MSLTFGRTQPALLVAILTLALGLVLVAPGARASSCSTVNNCKSGSSKAATSANQQYKKALNSLEDKIEEDMPPQVAAVRGLSNTDTQDGGHANFARTANADNTAAMTESAITGVEERKDFSRSFVPSLSTCALATRNIALSKREFSNAQLMRQSISSQRANDYLLNKPGTPAGVSALGASSQIFKDSLNGFCDPAVLNPPAGITCTQVNDSKGEPMAWRFAQPYKAIFSQTAIPEDPNNHEYKAARMFARFLVEPVPPDPIRGAALARDQGRLAYLHRLHDVAALSLAHGAIDRLIDERLKSPNGENSLWEERRKVWSDFTQAQNDANARAAQSVDTNFDDMPGVLRDINRIYLQIYLNMERIAAIKATKLARLVKSTSAGSPGAAGRIMGN